MTIVLENGSYQLPKFMIGKIGKPLPKNSSSRLVDSVKEKTCVVLFHSVTSGFTHSSLKNFSECNFARTNNLKTLFFPRMLKSTHQPVIRSLNTGALDVFNAKKENIVTNVVNDLTKMMSLPLVLNLEYPIKEAESHYRKFLPAKRYEIYEDICFNNGIESLLNFNYNILPIIEVTHNYEEDRPILVKNKCENFLEIILFNLEHDISNHKFFGNSEYFIITDFLYRTAMVIPNSTKIYKEENYFSKIKNFLKIATSNQLSSVAVKDESEDSPDQETSIPEIKPIVIPAKPVIETLKKKNLKIKLEDMQKKAKMKNRQGKTVNITDLIEDTEIKPLKTKTTKGRFVDPALATIAFEGLDNTYLEDVYDRDIAKVFASISKDGTSPFFIESITRDNTSDPLNYKETFNIRYRNLEQNGKVNNFKIDVPVFTKDGYMFLNGVKWIITKQILAQPIIKVKPNEVLITTAYNKVSMERFRHNISKQIPFLRLTLDKIKEDSSSKFKVKSGRVKITRLGKRLSPEYTELSKFVVELYDSTNKYKFFLDSNSSVKEIQDKFPELKNVNIGNELLVGYDTSVEGIIEVYTIDNYGRVKTLRKNAVNQSQFEYRTEVETLADHISKKITQFNGNNYDFPKIAPRKYSYTRTKMLSQYLPTAVIVGFMEGLEKLLIRSGVEYYLIPDGVVPPSGSDLAKVKFKNATLFYKDTFLRHTLLLRGLEEIDTADYNIEDFGEAGLGWSEFVINRLGTPGHVRALENYKTSFIDPITFELLKADNLPTDISGVLVHANNLLEDNVYKDANDMTQYRIRGSELVSGMLYKIIHMEMEKVRATKNSASPQALTVRQDQLIKNVLGASNTEEISELNPLLEAEIRGKVSWTGALGGMNDSGMVNRELRNFHHTMRGLTGYYSPDSKEAGVKRTLCVNAGIGDSRGRYKLREESKAGNLALGELLSPFTATHTDPPKFLGHCLNTQCESAN